ncbi:DEAD/DEAH box helicase, partial [Planctomycetota bacterium]|nr:DEAD/DEAH box helicase [Planctomycetota bacterium]
MSRPYMKLKAADLRILLEAKSDDEGFLEDLVAELARRKSQASRRLLLAASRLLADASAAQGGSDDEEDWEEDEDWDSDDFEVPEDGPNVDWDADTPSSADESTGTEATPRPSVALGGLDTLEARELTIGDSQVARAARNALAPEASSSDTSHAQLAEAPLATSPAGRWRQLQAVTDGARYATEEWDIAPPRIRPLQAARSEFEHQLHMAACEWDLDPAILIQSAADIQAREHWSDLLEPFEHQVKNLITFCRRAPVALIADDVGLGKTISAGLILSELMARGKVRRALIIVPKVSLLPQWQGELSERFRIKARHARGNELRYLLTADTDIVLTTYDSARNTMDEIAEAGFDMLILDEAHKLRNLHGTSKAPRTAVRFEEALRDRTFRYVLMLTATPIQNRLWDLYSLISLLTTAKGHINPLGSPDQFAGRYIADHRSTARKLHPGRKDEFRQILSQYMLRTRRDDANLVFPDRHLKTIAAVGDQHEQDLLRAVGTLIQGMNGLAQSSIAVSLMSSPHALVAQLRNMKARGTISASDLKRVETIANRIPRSAKEQVLVDFIRSLQKGRLNDWRLVIFTGRIETQAAIGLMLEAEFGQGCIGYIRGSKHAANQAAIAGYTASPPTVHVIISTEAGSEGLNLQAGNVLVNFDLPWNPMVLEQRIGRVQRMGSTFGSVAIVNLVLKGSVEEHVVDRLSSKLAVISSTLGDIEGILEALPGDAGEEEAFERKIRDLVIASLTGMDVEKSVRKIQQSIESAKQIYEEEKSTVQQTLGRLDAMHDEGPRMPGLSLTEPRMTEQDFALGALSLSEGTLETVDEDRWRFTRRGFAPEDVVFTQSA